MRGLAVASLFVLTTCAHVATHGVEFVGQPPDDIDRALEIVLETFAEAFGVRPPVERITWVYEDECGVDHPSKKHAGGCVSGLARGCVLWVAMRDEISESSLAHVVAHCAGWSHSRPDARYEPLITKANGRLREAGL